jgi:hypothetical protein
LHLDSPVSRTTRPPVTLGERTPELVIVVLAAALLAGALALGSPGGGGGAPARAQPRAAPVRVSAAHVALVERRVEALRGLRFRRPVPVAVISPAQARRIGLADERRTVTPASRHATEEQLKLLALLAPRDDLERITAAIYGEQVAGFYDPRSKRLVLVRGLGVDDITLAHELTHALEDQHFGIDRADGASDDDAATAYSALIEGTATEVMLRYALRYPDSAPSAGDAVKALAQTTSGTPLPPSVMRSLLFPYLAGQRFVAALRGGRRGWALVNVAERFRPPASTAEVLDPVRWLRFERPAVVRLPGLGRALGRGWRRLAAGTFGEEDTSELLFSSSGAARAARAAAGWRGGRIELSRRGPLPDPRCAAPCHARDALVLAWRVTSPHAARTLAAALARWLRGDVQAAPVRGGAWRVLGGSGAALAVHGSAVRVALAPTATLAERLTR